jgi:hypothetical protein
MGTGVALQRLIPDSGFWILFSFSFSQIYSPSSYTMFLGGMLPNYVWWKIMLDNDDTIRARSRQYATSFFVKII